MILTGGNNPVNSDTLVILSNYKRPTQIPSCISAWKCQSIKPASIVVVDNSPSPCDEDRPERYPNPLFEGADDVWRWQRNLGCPARFAPALCLYQYKYILFADDDLLPGDMALEGVLELANSTDRFSSIGQYGRIIDLYKPSGRKYISGNCYRSALPEIADLTCRCHLVRSEFLRNMLEFRALLWNRFHDTEHVKLLDTHDDMMLCFGIQYCTGYPSYVIANQQDVQRQLILRNLTEPDAIWKRPGHFTERNQMVEMCLEVGWRPIR